MAQLNLGRVRGNSAYEIAVNNGYVGTEQDWLDSIKGEKGMVPIIDPTTDKWVIGYDTGIKDNSVDIPTVNPSTNHWEIGGVDTYVVDEPNIAAYISPYNNNWIIGFITTIPAQGRSITNISTDSQGTVTVYFSDGTSKVVGTLSINVQADFLTSGGFGNLRFDSSTHKIQYTQDNGTSWNDVAITNQNTYIFNMSPQPMISLNGIYDPSVGHYKLKFEEPKDTIIDNQAACIVEKLIIVRKQNSAPLNSSDGTKVGEIPRKLFGTYKNNYYEDTTFTPSLNSIWYYGVFPVSTIGFESLSSANITEELVAKDFIIFGFTLNQKEAYPGGWDSTYSKFTEGMISYNLKYSYNGVDYYVDNKSFSPAKMNFLNDSFDYADWKNAFFIPRPCMLKQNGKVWKYLDKNDYSLFDDGTDASSYIDGTNNSDDDNSILNVMMEFPKTYFKYVDNGDDTANIYISNKKLDSDFNCWAWLDMNGDEADYTYLAAYPGSYDGTQLRSLSGKKPMNNATAEQEVNRAKANNIGNDMAWNTKTYSDLIFIDTLLMLIGKSTNSQNTFGYGHYTGGRDAGSIINTGTANNKGLFWGSNGSWKTIKVFGIDHFWGNQWERLAGLIYDKGTLKAKLTYSQVDGSTVDGYNFDGSNYLSIGSMPITSFSYITKLKIGNFGFFPLASGGGSNMFYCDSIWVNANQIDYFAIGASCFDDFAVGFCAFNFNDSYLAASTVYSAALSCKPLA